MSALVSSACSAALLAVAGKRPATRGPAPPVTDGETVIVEGERVSDQAGIPVIQRLKTIIAEANSDQLARSRSRSAQWLSACRDEWTGPLTRMIREKCICFRRRRGRSEAAFGQCHGDLLIDEPLEFVRGLCKEEPSFFSSR